MRVEGAAAAFQAPPPPPANPSDKHDKEGDGSFGGPNQSFGSNLRFTQSEWDSLADSEREMFHSQAPAGDAPREDVVIPPSVQMAPFAAADLPKAPPCSATPVSAACSNLPARPISPLVRVLKISLALLLETWWNPNTPQRRNPQFASTRLRAGPPRARSNL